MSNFDDKLKRALTDDSRQLDDLVARAQPGVIDMTLSVFRGQSKLLTAMMIFPSLIGMVLGVVMAVRFYQADTTRDQIMYATLFMFFCMVIMAMKVYFWMSMNRNATVREIKRLELQVAELSRRVGG